MFACYLFGDFCEVKKTAKLGDANNLNSIISLELPKKIVETKCAKMNSVSSLHSLMAGEWRVFLSSFTV